jgi:hypothetical protein
VILLEINDINELEKYNLNGFLTGTVMINDDPKKEGRIGVWIPKLMGNISKNGQPKMDKESFTNNMQANENNINPNSPISNSNYWWVRPTNMVDVAKQTEQYKENGDKVESYNLETVQSSQGSYRVPRLGQEIIVIFLDGDPQKGYYLPLTPTTTQEVIDALHIYNKDNWNDLSKKKNIEVIREYWNGNIIAVDTNPETNTLTITFDDGEGSKGHEFRIEYNDNVSQIEITTKEGHNFLIDDYHKNIKINTINGHFIEMNDPGGTANDETSEDYIHLETVKGHKIKMDDKNNVIDIQDFNGNQIIFKTDSNDIDITVANNLNITAANNVNVNAGNAINHTAGSAINDNAGAIHHN